MNFLYTILVTFCRGLGGKERERSCSGCNKPRIPPLLICFSPALRHSSPAAKVPSTFQFSRIKAGFSSQIWRSIFPAGTKFYTRTPFCAPLYALGSLCSLVRRCIHSRAVKQQKTRKSFRKHAIGTAMFAQT